MPLTTSLVGYMFGPVHITMLNGFVFLGHQVGSFLGGWGGGMLFDLQGNYDADVVDLDRARHRLRPAALADRREAGGAAAARGAQPA